MIRITDLLPGDQARLIDFGQTDKGFRRKLLSFGLTPGVKINIIRVAPLGCPIQIEVRGTLLALRQTEINDLLWERIL